MSIVNEIQRTIHAIRRAADCDVERLCFEVSETEWNELIEWLRAHGWHERAKGDFVWNADHLTFMGIRVRKRSPDR